MELNLLTLEQELIEKKGELEDEWLVYERRKERIETEIKRLENTKKDLLSTIDEEKVALAKSVLSFEQGFERMNKKLIQEVISELVDGGEKLKRFYFGTKDIACFINQSFHAEYQEKPTNGHVGFTIGLKRPYMPLTEKKIEASIYFLHLLLQPNEDGRMLHVS